MDKKTVKAVMSWLGKKTSPMKAAAARANGKKGGRPITRKVTDEN